MVTKYQDKNFLNATLVKILTTVSEKAPYFLFLRVSQKTIILILFWKIKSKLWHTFLYMKNRKIPNTKVTLKIAIYKPPRSIMNNYELHSYYKNIYDIDLKNKLFLYELELFSNKTLILNPFLTKHHKL